MPTVPASKGNIVQGPTPQVKPEYIQMAMAMELEQKQEELFQRSLIEPARPEAEASLAEQEMREHAGIISAAQTQHLNQRYPMLRDRMKAK